MLRHNQKLTPCALVSSSSLTARTVVPRLPSLSCWDLAPEGRAANNTSLQVDAHIVAKISQPLKAMIKSVSVVGPIGHESNEICPCGCYDEE